jgi:hypothetical protein
MALIGIPAIFVERSDKAPKSFRFLLDAIELVIERGQAAMMADEVTSRHLLEIAKARSIEIKPPLSQLQYFMHQATINSIQGTQLQENISNIFYMAIIELLAPLASFAQHNPKLFSDSKLGTLQRLHGLFDAGVDFLGNAQSLLTDVTCAVAAITSPAHLLHRNALQSMQDGMRKCFKLSGSSKTAQIFVERAHTLQTLQKNDYETQYAMQGLSEVYQEFAGPYTGRANDKAMHFDAFIATYAPRGSLLAARAIENYDRNIRILINKKYSSDDLNFFTDFYFGPWLSERTSAYQLNLDFAAVLVTHSEALGGSLTKAKRPIANAKRISEAPANKAGD